MAVVLRSTTATSGDATFVAESTLSAGSVATDPVVGAGNSQDTGVSSGNAAVDDSGDVKVESGTAGTDSGDVHMSSGNATGNSGDVWVVSGNGGTDSGDAGFGTGTATAGDSGKVEISSGTATAVDSGDVSVSTGNANVDSGTVMIWSGDAATGDSGDIILVPGDAPGGNTGYVKFLNPVDTSSSLFVEVSGLDAGMELPLLAEAVTLSEGNDIQNADVLLLNGTPYEVVGAPPAGWYVEFISATIYYNYGGVAAYTAGAGDDLQFVLGGAVVSATCETTGFITGAASAVRHVPAIAGADYTPAPATAVTLFCTNANPGGGDVANYLRVTVRFRLCRSN